MSLRVLVTGAAGQIAYSLLYSIAKGDIFGKDQPITLVMLDIPPMIGVVNGVVLELQDCSLPLLKEIVPTSDVSEAFKDIDACIMVGAMPRREGMERKDLLKANVKIFETQGKALDQFAKKTVKVLVVGNPANTNCLTMMKNAPSISKKNFTALTRLDQNRAQSQIAMRVGVACNAVTNSIIWGNHSTTQFPDVAHAKVNGTPVYEAVKDDDWLKGEFITTVQNRGGVVLKTRKMSSAMSAAKAIGDHMRDWWFGTQPDQWVSMGVNSTGNPYGIADDLIYSFPVRIKDREWEFVTDLPINDFSREKLDTTEKELIGERDIAMTFLSSQ